MPSNEYLKCVYAYTVHVHIHVHIYIYVCVYLVSVIIVWVLNKLDDKLKMKNAIFNFFNGINPEKLYINLYCGFPIYLFYSEKK